MDLQRFRRLYSTSTPFYKVYKFGFILLLACYLYSSFIFQLNSSKARLQSELENSLQWTATFIDEEQIQRLTSHESHITEHPEYDQLNRFFSKVIQTSPQPYPLSFQLLDNTQRPLYTFIPSDTIKLRANRQQTTPLLAHSNDSIRVLSGSASNTTITAQVFLDEKTALQQVVLKADLAVPDKALLKTTFLAMPWLNLSVFLFFSIIGFVSMNRSFHKRHQKANHLQDILSSRNQEITLQDNQIKAQDEWINNTLQELEEAKQTIELRNKELTILNKVLDFKVKRRTQELEKTSMELSTFLYRSSHDIMGPIATLKGLCNLALDELHDSAGKSYIKLVNTTVEQLSQTIRNISVVFEIRNRHLNFHAISLHAFIDDLYSNQTKYQSLDNIELLNDIPEELQLISDSYLMETMFSELIQSCLKSLKNRKTQLGSLQPNAYIKISAKASMDKAEIKVDDSGVGLSKALENELNTLFSQQANAKNKGYSMGLYVVKAVVERLKGNIRILPKNEAGTTFLIQLPLRKKTKASV